MRMLRLLFLGVYNPDSYNPKPFPPLVVRPRRFLLSAHPNPTSRFAAMVDSTPNHIQEFLSCLFVCLFDLSLYVPSTIFQLYRDGSSWVEQVLSWDKCVLLKDHNALTPVRLEPAALRSRVKHSTTEPPRSQFLSCIVIIKRVIYRNRLGLN